MKFILSALAAAALWVVDAQNVQTYTFYQDPREAFATGLPNVDKGATNVAVIGVYSDDLYQTKIGESVTTCIQTGEPTLYNNAPVPPVILNSQAMCHGELVIWEQGSTTAVSGTFILQGVIDAFVFGKDTAIVGGTGAFAGAQGIVNGTGLASVAFYVVPINL